MDKNIIQPVGQEFQPASDPQRVGAPGRTIHTFQAVGTGTSILRLEYARPWETDVEPQDIFQVQIIVQ